MSAFEQASKIEKMAREELLPWLIHICEKVEDTTDYSFLQKILGDFIVTRRDKVSSLELKAEHENGYGNFFLETWSNRKWFNPGWMITSQADYLLYYFVTERELYVISMPRLKEWAFCDYIDEQGNQHAGHIYNYREKPQGKYNQLNDTWGRCVKIADVQAAMGADCKLITKELRDSMMEAA